MSEKTVIEQTKEPITKTFNGELLRPWFEIG